jgi:hypothetical protein
MGASHKRVTRPFDVFRYRLNKLPLCLIRAQRQGNVTSRPAHGAEMAASAAGGNGNMSSRRFGLHLRFLALGGTLLVAIASAAGATSQIPDVQKIVEDASWNEIHSSGPSHPFRYRLAKEDPKGSTVKLIVETKDGQVARLIEKNGRPLTPAEDRAEIARLDNLLAHPEIQERRHKKEQEDSARGDELVRVLPHAFLYTYEGIEQGPSGPYYRLSFKPNPAFVPPDREGEVFHGMEGDLWIDKSQLRLAKFDAHLMSDVNFGWGFFGKLYNGGSILVEDADVGSSHWESLLMRLRLQGKILMVKNEDFSTTETSSDFHPVPPDMTYQDAIRMLKEYKAPL